MSGAAGNPHRRFERETLAQVLATKDVEGPQAVPSRIFERLNGEFRRRTKTQGSFANEMAALVLLYGLVATGQIQMRKIDGHHTMEEVLNAAA